MRFDVDVLLLLFAFFVLRYAIDVQHICSAIQARGGKTSITVIMVTRVFQKRKIVEKSDLFIGANMFGKPIFQILDFYLEKLAFLSRFFAFDKSALFQVTKMGLRALKSKKGLQKSCKTTPKMVN